jgi:hypothetical protein
MKVSSEELKRLYQERKTRDGTLSSECAAPDLLMRAAANELEPRERDRLADHLIQCSDCAGEYRLVASLASETSPAGAVAETRRWIGWVFANPARRAAAAAAVLIVAAGVWLGVSRSSAPDNVTPNSRGAAPLFTAVQPEDGAVVAGAAGRLSWSSKLPAESYQVIVYDLEATPIWESQQTREIYIDLPEQVRARFKAGGVFYWRVISRRGVDYQRSELFRFTISE